MRAVSRTARFLSRTDRAALRGESFSKWRAARAARMHPRIEAIFPQHFARVSRASRTQSARNANRVRERVASGTARE